ncbi:energy transducer TonB [Xenophilus azovorans]|uniref:energy transducer TonB n=1 Tax=Xenophilus azovorans TaxID=151755 RepID=UPI00068D39CA|nr:energy transducer TonB [Xenophilus azovorans]
MHCGLPGRWAAVALLALCAGACTRQVPRVQDSAPEPVPAVEALPPGPPVMHTPAPRPGARPAPEPLDSEPVEVPPRLLARVDPRYPEELLDQETRGTVRVRFTVDRSGRVRDAQIVSASHPAFAKAVREVLPRWRFQPARGASGAAIPARVEVPVRFELVD